MYKSLLILLFSAFVLTSVSAEDANKGKTLPQVKVKTLVGEKVDISELKNDGKPIVISFWATWCSPCMLELNTINDVYEDWQEETGVKLYAVSLDDSRNSRKVAPLVKGKGWKFDVLLDENADLKRAMGVNNPPHTFLINAEGEIVWEHNGYAPGDEEELYKKIKELAGKN